MPHTLSSEKYVHAVVEFNQQAHRDDGKQVVPCLAAGLVLIRDSLYPRLHQDAERHVGKDSMLMPVSEMRAAQRTLEQINLYQVAEVAATVAQRGYVGELGEWFTPWLLQLLLDGNNITEEHERRLKNYATQTPEQRRSTFLDALAQVLPISARAPLVLFRLLPLAIQIAVANAFGDRVVAVELRRQQIALLPAITDCHHCKGRVLEDIEKCPSCGNPIWKYEWLRAAD